jgi:hypothetical protein
MLRTFFVLLFGALLLSQAGAQECRDIQTPASRRVDQYSKGYDPVGIIIKLPVAQTIDPKTVAQKADFVFWIQAAAKDFRLNKGMYLQSASICTGVRMERNGKIISGPMLRLKVRALVSERYSMSHGYVLAAGIFLPRSLVRSHPAAGTQLASGQKFQGVWLKEGNVAILALEPL